jgi:hypothetical protein
MPAIAPVIFLLLLVPGTAFAAEAVQPSCAITEMLQPAGDRLRFPSQVSQAPYLYALCDLLAETYAAMMQQGQQIQVDRERLSTERRTAESDALKIGERLLTLEAEEAAARKQHIEMLAKALERHGKTLPFREGAFWTDWNQEQERYSKASYSLGENALALRKDLDHMLTQESGKSQKQSIEEIRRALDRIINRRKP